jgi:hypothetical protein
VSEGTYDSGKIIDVLSQSTAVNADVSTVSVGTSPVVLLGFNTARSFVLLQNLGSRVYIALGYSVSTNSYSFYLEPGQMVSLDKWGGPLAAVRAASTDNILITEIIS